MCWIFQLTTLNGRSLNQYAFSVGMFGVSDHDLMFSQEPDDVNEGIIDSEKDVIHSKVIELSCFLLPITLNTKSCF